MSNRPTAIEGLEFVEFAVSDPAPLTALLAALGFRATARHRSKDVTLYRAGNINFIVNATDGSFAQAFARQHGPSICALALRVPDATSAYQQLLELGAWEAATSAGAMELNIPAIESIGGSQIYLVDRYGDDLSIYDVDFRPLDDDADVPPNLECLRCIGLSTGHGRADEWRAFMSRLFDFEVLADASLLSPDKTLRLELDEREELIDERISALWLGAADPASLVQQLKAAGIEAEPLGAGNYRLQTPLEGAAFDIFITA